MVPITLRRVREPENCSLHRVSKWPIPESIALLVVSSALTGRRRSKDKYDVNYGLIIKRYEPGKLSQWIKKTGI